MKWLINFASVVQNRVITHSDSDSFQLFLNLQFSRDYHREASRSARAMLLLFEYAKNVDTWSNGNYQTLKELYENWDPNERKFQVVKLSRFASLKFLKFAINSIECNERFFWNKYIYIWNTIINFHERYGANNILSLMIYHWERAGIISSCKRERYFFQCSIAEN